MDHPDPEGSYVFLIAIGGLLLAVSWYLGAIAASIAVARSRKSVLRSMVEEDHAGASRASDLVDEAGYYLLCSQFGRVVSSIAIGGFLVLLSYDVAQRLSHGEGGALMYVWGIVACVLYCTAVATLLVAVQVVKSVAFEIPELVLCFLAIPLRVYAGLCGPVLKFAERLISRVLSWWGIDAANERELRISSAELGEIVRTSAEAGTLERAEGQILEGVAEMSERTARDVMTPRRQIVWVQESSSTSQVIDICRRESISRLLVSVGEIDDVRGVLLTKDLLAFAGQAIEPGSWRKFIRPVFRIPDTKVVKELLVELRQRQTHFSVVLNEHGEVVGVVTLEDLVEELVGEIFDEFDNPQAEIPTINEESGILYFDGALPLTSLYERVGVRAFQVESQTVAGFVHEVLGRMPVDGDSFSIDGLTFVVLEAKKNQIVRISVTQCKEYQPETSTVLAVGGE